MQFEKDYDVHVYETGPDGKLSLCSLFNYLQDIASDHAIKLGFGRHDLMRDNRFWVLSRMYAEIETLPAWEDRISITTWPNGTDRLFALRNYDVRYPDGRHIASASSSWLILDRTTRKVQRPDAILSKFYSDLVPNHTPLRYASKIDYAEDATEKREEYRIRVSDLDVNFHTNNVRYLSWIADGYDLDFVMKNVPISVEINYLAESQFAEEIMIRSAAVRDDVQLFRHSIVRTTDSRELCRMEIKWQNIDNK